jgi:hypothetical protein
MIRWPCTWLIKMVKALLLSPLPLLALLALLSFLLSPSLAYCADRGEVFGPPAIPAQTGIAYAMDSEGCRGGSVTWASTLSARLDVQPRSPGETLRRTPRGTVVLATWPTSAIGKVALLRFKVTGGTCAGKIGNIQPLILPPLTVSLPRPGCIASRVCTCGGYCGPRTRTGR